jgi:signal transduction histidine kinase
MRTSCRRHRPLWWPESEPWPPRRRAGFRMDSRSRARFFRRIALAGLAVLALATSAVFVAAWTLANRFGLSGGAAALPTAVVLFAAGIILVGMFGAMRRFASPLRAVMDAADRVAEGDYRVRVPESGPPPMRALSHAFNTMTERLQNADRVRRNLMADIAHELRTPLSVLQGRLEGLLDGVYQRDDQQMSELLNETRVLSRLIEDLRTLALSEAGALPLQTEMSDIVDLVQDAVRTIRTEATRSSVALNVNAPPTRIVIDVDPVRIREVLTNLLSNAVRHTAAGGAVTVSVSSTDEAATVAVSDTGEGMRPEELERIFDRFYKGPASRGSGLGLTIAKGLINAHGGEIAAASQRGTGTTVSFTLPRA